MPGPSIDSPWAPVVFTTVFASPPAYPLPVIEMVPFTVTARRFAWLNRHLATVSGMLSVAFGLWLAYQIGVVDGLFSASPHWSPE